jgi:hypothetical protein
VIAIPIPAVADCALRKQMEIVRIREPSLPRGCAAVPARLERQFVNRTLQSSGGIAMSDRGFWSVCGMATAASIVLVSCGDGVGELVAATTFIGSAGGWQEDDNSTHPGLQQRFACRIEIRDGQRRVEFTGVDQRGGSTGCELTAAGRPT